MNQYASSNRGEKDDRYVWCKGTVEILRQRTHQGEGGSYRLTFDVAASDSYTPQGGETIFNAYEYPLVMWNDRARAVQGEGHVNKFEQCGEGDIIFFTAYLKSYDHKDKGHQIYLSPLSIKVEEKAPANSVDDGSIPF